MEKAEAVNPFSVRIRFKEPFPEFLEYLLPGATTFGWIAPKKYVEKVGDAGFKKHPVGAGPYKFVEHVPGVKLVGEAFEDIFRHAKRRIILACFASNIHRMQQAADVAVECGRKVTVIGRSTRIPAGMAIGPGCTIYPDLRPEQFTKKEIPSGEAVQ